MNRNLVGNIYGRSSIKIVDFAPISLQTWPPQAIFVSDWLIFKKSSHLKPALPNESKLGRNHPWKVIYKDCSLVPIRLQTWPPYTRFLFLIGRVFKIFFSETALPNESNLVRSILGSSSIKNANLIHIR